MVGTIHRVVLYTGILPEEAILRHAQAFAKPSSGGSSGQTQTFLIDFGSADTTTGHADSPGDPVNCWNNVPETIGASNTGQLLSLVTTNNTATGVNLIIIRRFNGANASGTTDPAPFPINATRDSLFGNTETFSDLANIFPSFNSPDWTRRRLMTSISTRRAWEYPTIGRPFIPWKEPQRTRPR